MSWLLNFVGVSSYSEINFLRLGHECCFMWLIKSSIALTLGQIAVRSTVSHWKTLEKLLKWGRTPDSKQVVAKNLYCHRLETIPLAVGSPQKLKLVSSVFNILLPLPHQVKAI